jgi:hypothetical protein
MKKVVLPVMAIATLSACATQPDKIATSYVSPIQYESYTCEQVGAEMQRVARRASSLHSNLKQTADNDAVQMGIGLVLFWPALFFVEGGDGSEAAEYARLKGEHDALEQAGIQKNCGIKVEPLVPAPVPATTSTQATTNG